MSGAIKKLLAPYHFYFVGSLPFRSAEQAVSFILSNPEILPFWPELTQVSPLEEMLPRAERTLASGWQGFSKDEASGLYEFAATVKRDPSPIPIFKTQIMGPLSFALYSEYLEGGLEDKLRITTESVQRQISWLHDYCSDFAENILLVLDEPGCGTLESLSVPELEAARDSLSYLYVLAREQNIYLGIHNCGKLSALFFDLPADLLSFDATSLADLAVFERLTPAISAVNSRGSIIVPGLYPAIDDPSLVDKMGQISELESKIQNQFPTGLTLRSAVCGHAGASESLISALYLQ